MSTRTTIFSPCRKYRYVLWREMWKRFAPGPMCRDCADFGPVCPVSGRRCAPGDYLLVIGLNPSTADETNDDPTIRRCMDFAIRWGFGTLCMANLFAWRDTKPQAMKKAAFPIGIDNDHHLIQLASGAVLVLAAWGKHGPFGNRDLAVLDQLNRVGVKIHCLDKNKDGTPKHPLYVPSITRPKLYSFKEAA